MHYVIGDVHGCYHTLLALIKKLPQDAKLIFVGDLIDRGTQSKDVISLVQENQYECVLGNHEIMMIEFADAVCTKQFEISNFRPWLKNGGIETLLAYNLIKTRYGEPFWLNDKDAIELFLDDVSYIDLFPFYIEKEINDRTYLITHSVMTTMLYKIKDDGMKQSKFQDEIVWNRESISKPLHYFNVFGHSPTNEVVEHHNGYINIDSGCYLKSEGMGKLSAFCLETHEIIQQVRIDE